MTGDMEQRIIRILADGKFHSGEQVAAHLGISRTSVWKKIQAVKERYELEIHAVSGRGYWLPDGIELLDEEIIRGRIPDDLKSNIAHLQVFDKLDSTNRFLLESNDVLPARFSVCLAEMQTHGRGRRGRQWLSPFGKNIQLSVASHLNMPMSQIAGLSIAVGVAVADAVARLGLSQVALKWPNDIHVDQHKLAGLLVEIKGESEGPVKTVIGIGLNVDLPRQLSDRIDQPVTDLVRHLAGEPPMRNDIAVSLIAHVCQAVKQFSESGLDEFILRWQQYDAYQGKKVVMKNAADAVEGVYLGLDNTGALLLETAQGVKAFNAGEVSMRGCGVSS